MVVKFMCEFFGCDYCVLLTVNMFNNWTNITSTLHNMFTASNTH